MRLIALLAPALLLVFYPAVGQQLASQTKIKPDGINNANVIEGRCAVVVRPDNKKIARMRSEGSREEYDASVNDNEYYVGTSIAFLDAAKVKQIYKPAHGVLVFKSSSGRYFKVPLTTVYWSIFLFNGRTKPIEADITDIGSTYRLYMKKKRN